MCLLPGSTSLQIKRWIRQMDNYKKGQNAQLILCRFLKVICTIFVITLAKQASRISTLFGLYNQLTIVVGIVYHSYLIGRLGFEQSFEWIFFKLILVIDD